MPSRIAPDFGGYEPRPGGAGNWPVSRSLLNRKRRSFRPPRSSTNGGKKLSSGTRQKPLDRPDCGRSRERRKELGPALATPVETRGRRCGRSLADRVQETPADRSLRRSQRPRSVLPRWLAMARSRSWYHPTLIRRRGERCRHRLRQISAGTNPARAARNWSVPRSGTNREHRYLAPTIGPAKLPVNERRPEPQSGPNMERHGARKGLGAAMTTPLEISAN